jgi:hypothetical protein
MRRRALLAALLPLVAGCAGTSDPAGRVPSMSGDGDRPSADAKRPTRTATDQPLSNLPELDDCTLADRPSGDYPSLPDSLTESSASAFALDHEQTYAAGKLAVDPEVDVEGVAETESDVAETTKEGVLLHVHVSFDYTESAGTATVVGNAESRAWYYVTDDYAIRAHDRGTDVVPEVGWMPVACAAE